MQNSKKKLLKWLNRGVPFPEVAQSLGIGNNLIYYWVKRSKKKGIIPLLKADDSFDEDKAALHKKIKELEMERDILKKALGIFSR